MASACRSTPLLISFKPANSFSCSRPWSKLHWLPATAIIRRTPAEYPVPCKSSSLPRGLWSFRHWGKRSGPLQLRLAGHIHGECWWRRATRFRPAVATELPHQLDASHPVRPSPRLPDPALRSCLERRRSSGGTLGFPALPHDGLQQPFFLAVSSRPVGARPFVGRRSSC